MTDADRLDLGNIVHRACPGLDRCVLEITSGNELVVDTGSWRDAIVFVLDGELDVCCSSGGGHRFGRGDILCFAGLPVQAVRNNGPAPTRLLAIWRHGTHR